ncbi:diguanylate cyclase [Saccharibacillus sp. JS10]|uniref:sensor domain-containing diguanylate cyclase n=1 Tax=Saccharibacillus sp. JS10 TaxID=2950552 RepID=UPI00210ADCD4|nr:diguanylate cyclase [Saccharibacillus sp. JS10]MCQ4086277.1 diguanylate cyclase [Saccharibacillus sp. JS10]
MSFRSLFRIDNETKLGLLLIRFSIAFLVVFALLLSFGYLFQHQVITNSYLHVRNLALLSENLDSLEKSMVEQESGQRGFTLTGQQSFVTYYDRGAKDYAQVSQLLKERSSLTPAFSEEIDALIVEANHWQNQHSRFMMERSLRGESVSPDMLKEGEQTFTALNTKFDDLSSRITIKRNQNRENLISRITMTLTLTGIIVMISIAFYVLFIIKHIRRLILPLTGLDAAIAAYEGNTTQSDRHSYTTSSELSRLIQAFDRMGEDLRYESGQLEDTYKMINALNQAGSVQDVYRETLLHMRNLVQCDRISLAMQNNDRRFTSKAVIREHHLNLKESLSNEEQRIMRIMIQSGKSFLYENWEHKRPSGDVGEMLYGEDIRSSMHLLLKKEARVVGILNLYAVRSEFFTPTHIQRLEKLVPLIATVIDNALKTDRIQSLALRDGLTGLWNRRHFDENIARLKDEASAAPDSNLPFCLILLDVDRFKLFNDTRGHQEGDTVLRHIALLLQAYSRFGDLPFRFGGEEFAVLLPNTRLGEAVEVAERLRKLIEFDSPSTEYKVTASFGVSQFRRNEECQELIGKADAALYRAKAAGRNRVYTEDQGLDDSTLTQQSV